MAVFDSNTPASLLLLLSLHVRKTVLLLHLLIELLLLHLMQMVVLLRCRVHVGELVVGLLAQRATAQTQCLWVPLMLR